MIICYFGIYDSNFGRNKIYIKALKKYGHTILECKDNSKGLKKYFNLWKKHKFIKNDYDVMIIGYPGHIITPFAKFISKKMVIVDALGSLFDAEINSHNPTFFRKIKSKIADWLMVKFADKILLESFEQKKFFEEKYGKSDKYKVLYTGTDEEVFNGDFLNDKNKSSVENKKEKFTVLFRGKLTPESGIMYILEAMNILKGNKEIKLKIIGSGYYLKRVNDYILENKLGNIEFITNYLLDKELTKQMSDADISLGQFENNPRLNRTIPHKAFESFSMGIPYLTGDAPAIREISVNDENVFLVQLADSVEMAKKIEALSKNRELLNKVSINEKKLYREKFSFEIIAKSIINMIE